MRPWCPILTDLDKIFGSLGNEGFLSLQLSSTATIEIPSGTVGATIKVPSPSVLIGVAVKDDTLSKVIEASLAREKMPVLKTQTGTTVVTTVNLPFPSPIPLQPSYAIHAGFFLFGSTPAVLTDAITAFDAGGGLVDSADFKKTFQSLPMVNNGIAYLSPRFMKALMDLQALALSQPGQDSTGVSAVLRQLLGGGADVQSAFVIQNLADGVQVNGISSAGGKEVVGSMMVAPVGLVAAIAIPSFVKARTVSKQNACINNLRQVDSAKEQWAMEMGKAEGDPVSIPGISAYIKGNKLPVCPQGGTYQVNPIGKNPVCSMSGHALR